MLRLSILLCSVIPLAVWADPLPVLPNAAPDQIRPLAFDTQKVAGLLADRMGANQEGFLEHIDVASLLKPFNSNARHDSGGVAEGELAGRFLKAASNAYSYRHHPQLKELMDKVAGQILPHQSKNGYFGAYTSRERWTAADLLVHRWMLLGLLSYWQATGEEDAYTASQLIGDLLVNTWGAKGRERDQLGKSGPENLPLRLAALQTVGPLAFLYRYTADPNYLELCKSLVSAVNVASILPAFPASAEQLSGALLGLSDLADLYRITGDKSYMVPVVAYWNELAANRLLLTGTPDASPVVDSCVTVAWMQLTLDLLRITGESRYAQQLERTIYNQLLAAQDMQTGNIAQALGVSGKKNFSSKLLPDTGRYLLSEAEGLSLIPQTIWGRWRNGVAVNMYTAGRATVQLRRKGLVQIYSETSFPETGEVLLHVEPSHNIQFPLSLRVPDWASSFTVDAAGQHLIGKPGQPVIINREWKRGDVVRISMPMGVRLLQGLDGEMGRIAVMRGPQVLALGRTLNPQIHDLASAGVMLDAKSQLTLSPVTQTLPNAWQGDQVYQTEGEYEGKNRSLLLVPFADALNFQLWLKKSSVAQTAEE